MSKGLSVATQNALDNMAANTDLMTVAAQITKQYEVISREGDTGGYRQRTINRLVELYNSYARDLGEPDYGVPPKG